MSNLEYYNKLINQKHNEENFIHSFMLPLSFHRLLR